MAAAEAEAEAAPAPEASGSYAGAGGLSTGRKLVPCSSWAEWRFVRDGLFSPFPAAALRRIAAWRSRGSHLIPVDVTAAFVEIRLRDPFFRSGLPGDDAMESEEMLAMLYSMAIMRYPPHGRKPAKEEDAVQWSRLRSPPVGTPPHDLHASDCLEALRPGDHFKIQWRKNKDFPYGWRYGVVGHQASCNANEHLCRCHEDDTIVLEFQHYPPGSRWRQTTVSRKDHRETGDETDGFYGGIRKLQTKDEISTWRRFWPVDVLN